MKKLKLSQVLEEANLLEIEQKMNIDNVGIREETPHMAIWSIPGIARFRDKPDNSKFINVVMNDRKTKALLSKVIPSSYRSNEPTDVRKIKYVENAISDTFTFPRYSKFVRDIMVSLSSLCDSESMVISNSAIVSTDLKLHLGNMSAFKAMPNPVQNWFYDIVRQCQMFGVDTDSETCAKDHIPRILNLLMGWEIEHPTSSEVRKFLEWKDNTIAAVSSKYNIGGNHGPVNSNTFTTTSNCLLLRSYGGGNEIVYSGLFAIWKLLKSHMIGTHLDYRRRLKNHRNRRNHTYRDFLDTCNKKFNKESVLTTLMQFHPRTWESNPHIPTVPKYYAKSKFPHGSLCAVEIEFVANEDSPLIATDWEPCGECECCTNDDSDSCENMRPISDSSGSRTWEFFKNPMVHWTTDGSVSATTSKQRTLNYQEVRCVQNINDFSTLEKLTKWMNDAKCVVNRTCGLHVHLDTRDISARKYATIARKAQLATENWLQFCVPFSRFEGSYCSVYGRNRWDRYRAVNTTARDKHNTIEFRLGSGSTNYGKISKWIKLCHWIVRGKGNNTTLEGFLKSDANPELKAFVIARICKFFQSHEDARNPQNTNYNPIYRDANNPASKIPNDIREVVKTWQSVLVNELGEFRNQQ